MSLSVPFAEEQSSSGIRRPDFRATMGCFVEVAGQSAVYGLTCDHVTRYAADGILYVEDSSGRILEFGEVLQRQSSVEYTDSRDSVIDVSNLKPFDIDIIKITSKMTDSCKPVYRNTSGIVASCHLFKGDIQSLYGKKVFQCFINDSQKSIPAKFNCKFGIVGCDFAHQTFKTVLDLSAEFIVHGIESQFAFRGDSGRVVAREADDGGIEVIGIIVSGEYTGKETKSDESVCICLSLEKGLECLRREYGKAVNLKVSNDQGMNVRQVIEPGHMILGFSPTYSKRLNFDLVDQLLLLGECLDFTVKGETPLEMIVKFEADLNKQVYQREDLEWQNVTDRTADRRCTYKALKACEHVYGGELKQAEMCLKEASSMIASNSCFPLRLLCRVFCYSALLLLEIGSMEKAGEILEKGLSFMEEKKFEKSFPADCLGYYYYVYSRYFQKLPGACNREQAKERAFKAIEVLEDEHRNNGSPPETLALAYANYAHILLGIDDHSLVINCEIQADQVNQAELYLNQADEIKTNSNSVEDVHISKAWGEYHVRKDGYGEAIKCFEKGMAMAQSLNLKKEKRLCSERLTAIRAYLKGSKLPETVST